VWWRNHDNTFSRFDRVPACDGRTDRQTDVHPISITCFSIADARKNLTKPLYANHTDGIRTSITTSVRSRGLQLTFQIGNYISDCQKYMPRRNYFEWPMIVTNCIQSARPSATIRLSIAHCSLHCWILHNMVVKSNSVDINFLARPADHFVAYWLHVLVVE